MTWATFDYVPEDDDPTVTIAGIIEKLSGHEFCACTYVGKGYTKADLIADLQRLDTDAWSDMVERSLL